MVNLCKVSDMPGFSSTYHAPESMKLLKYEFVLVSEREVKNLRVQEALNAAANLGMNVKEVDGLLVRDE